MNLTETRTITRECCSEIHGDLVNLDRTTRSCSHCGKVWIRKRYTDAAGDTDWEWMPVPVKELKAREPIATELEIRRKWMKLMGSDDDEINAHCAAEIIADKDEELGHLAAALRLNSALRKNRMKE